MLTVAQRVHHPDKEPMCAKVLLYRCKRSGARVLRSYFSLIILLRGIGITAKLDEKHSHQVIGAAVWDFS